MHALTQCFVIIFLYNEYFFFLRNSNNVNRCNHWRSTVSKVFVSRQRVCSAWTDCVAIFCFYFENLNNYYLFLLVLSYLMPSKPSSEPLIVNTGARAYALATRRLRSNTITLAHISSSICVHLSKTSCMCSYK